MRENTGRINTGLTCMEVKSTRKEINNMTPVKLYPDVDYTLLPSHIRQGMELWIEYGVPPGDFLQAVIRNDLVDSFARADEKNILEMFHIAGFMYNEAPGPCWRTAEAIEQWPEYVRELRKERED